MSLDHATNQVPSSGFSQYTIHGKLDTRKLRKESVDTVQNTPNTFRLAWLTLGEVVDAACQTGSTSSGESRIMMWNPFDNLFTGEIKRPARHVGEGHPGPCSPATEENTGSGCTVPTSSIPYRVRARLTSDCELRVDKTEEEWARYLELRAHGGGDELALLGTAAVSAVSDQSDEGREVSMISTGVQYPLGNVPIEITGSSFLEGETGERTMSGHVPLMFTVSLC